MTKKKVLIAYGGMVVGGSTTALLSMLKEWNFEKYDVDLILYDRGFPFEKDIPNQVHILNGRRSMPNGYMQRLKKGIQYVLSPYWIKKEWYALKYKDRRAGLYAIGQFKVKKLSCKLKEQYDIAMGYLEDWSDEFIAYNVEAAQKIMWIHLDFANVQYINKSLTERYLSKADKIVCVSVECLKNFNKLFPDLSSRSVYLPNINFTALGSVVILEKAPIVSKNLESDKYENEKVKAAAEQFKSAEEGTAVSDIFAAAGKGTTVKDQNGEDKDISQYKTCGSLVEVAMKLGDEYFTNAECQFEGTVQMDLEQVDYKALLKSAGIDENTSDEDLLNVEEFEAPDYVLAQLNAVSGEASVSTGLKFGFEKVEGSDRPVLVIKGTFNGLGPVALASKAE